MVLYNNITHISLLCECHYGGVRQIYFILFVLVGDEPLITILAYFLSHFLSLLLTHSLYVVSGNSQEYPLNR